MGETNRVRMRITGRVQGVAFRAYTCEEGRRLGLRGYIRNLPDGDVEVVAEGEPDGLEALERFCWVGPPTARVRDVDVTPEPAGRPLPAFHIAY